MVPSHRIDAMPGRRRALAAVLLALMLGAVAHAQPRDAPLPPEAAAVVERWLRGSCLGEEAPARTIELRRYGATVAPALRRALQHGPPAGEIAAVREAAARRQAERAKFDWSGIEVTGVSRDALARGAREPPRAFVDDQVRRFVNGWKSNAIAGLAIVGAAQDRTLLRRIAARSADPLAPAARAALQSLATPR
jgi:transposase InsO family protein